MKDIKGKKIAVLCDTEEKIKKMIDSMVYTPFTSAAERFSCFGENTCQAICNDNQVIYGDKDWYESMGYQIITFEDFMEQPKYSAEEILGWLMKNYSRKKYVSAFGEDYEYYEIFANFAPSEIVERISIQLDRENKIVKISKSSYDKIATEQLDRLYPNGWKVEE